MNQLTNILRTFIIKNGSNLKYHLAPKSRNGLNILYGYYFLYNFSYSLTQCMYYLRGILYIIDFSSQKALSAQGPR